MDAEKKRDELFAEYLKMIDIVQGYDGHFLNIKAWSVTTSSLAFGVVLAESADPWLLVVVVMLAISFWMTEVRFKVLQQSHVYRLSTLEDALSRDEQVRAPDMINSFTRASQFNTQRRMWRKIAFWPHVMFPHIVFVIASMALFALLLVRM